MIEKAEKAGNVTIHNGSRVKSVEGDGFVTGIKVLTAGEEKMIPVKGVFVEIGLIPNSAFAPDLDKNGDAEIVVNCSNETNMPGVFAAGDVTDVPEKQIVIAAGEGAKAALGAFRYISRSSPAEANW